jgi:hypothetical protein
MLERACRHFLPNVFCSSAGIALPFQDENSFIFRRRLVSGGCSDPVLHSIRPILGALITHRLASARHVRTFRFTPFPVGRFYVSCSSHPLTQPYMPRWALSNYHAFSPSQRFIIPFPRRNF